MVLHRSKAALAGALALMGVGCAADMADDAQSELMDTTEEAAPAQALLMQADVSSADNGSSSAGPSGSSGSSGSGRAPVQPVQPRDDEEEEDDNQGRASPTSPTSGSNWDAASVARFCFLLDQRMQFLCRVTLTDCTKPARPLDIFTQVLCQLRGFTPGAPASTPSSSSDSNGRASPSGI